MDPESGKTRGYHRSALRERLRGSNAAVHDLVVSGFFGGDANAVKPEDRSPDFTFIHKKVLPALLAVGVTQEQFDKMIVENPKNFFEGVKL